MCLAFVEAKCEAAPALAEDITLDDPFAEVTAPAEARNIVRGADEVPESATQDDVAEEPVQSPEAVPAVAEDITPDGPFAEVIVPGEAAPALAEDITLDDPFAEVTAPAEARNIVRGADVPESATQDDVAEEPVKSPEACGPLSVVSAAWKVPESATQDDVAEEPVKSPEACGPLSSHLDTLVSGQIWDC
eukprot:s6654_g1.t2